MLHAFNLFSHFGAAFPNKRVEMRRPGSVSLLSPDTTCTRRGRRPQIHPPNLGTPPQIAEPPSTPPLIDTPVPQLPIHHSGTPLLPTAPHRGPVTPKGVGSIAGSVRLGRSWGGRRCPPLIPARCHRATLGPRCASAAQSSPWGRFIWEQTHLAPRWGGQRAAFISHALRAAPQGLWGSTATAHAPQNDPIRGRADPLPPPFSDASAFGAHVHAADEATPRRC